MSSPYAIDKVVRHPHVIRSLLDRDSHNLAPVLMHLMPMNGCNQNCAFCSYRIKGNKNADKFTKFANLPWETCRELLGDFEKMGGRAVEITGGGEPVLYPHFFDMLEYLAGTSLDTALVTNGTLLSVKAVELLSRTRLKWARVSIDAGSRETYCRLRGARQSDWDMAWNGVRMLAGAMDRSAGQRLGVGFVVCEENSSEVAKFIHIASESGADNVRISVAFTPKGADILNPDQEKWVRDCLDYAKQYARPDFIIHDLFAERMHNLRYPEENAGYCPTKDILCVVEGEGSVYTCCTLTGSGKGLMGNILEERFSDLWRKKAEWRKNLPTEVLCTGAACLYASRNRFMNALREPGLHENYI